MSAVNFDFLKTCSIHFIKNIEVIAKSVFFYLRKKILHTWEQKNF